MRFFRYKFLVLVTLLFSATACNAENIKHLPTEDIKIMSAGTQRMAVTAEIATEDIDLQKGLMGRTQMDANHGMLFVFENNGVIRFWMKNTLIPLDMIFIDQDGRIVKIHDMATPGDESYIASDFPVRAVLEINGGEAAKNNLTVGDLVLSKTLDTEVQTVSGEE